MIAPAPLDAHAVGHALQPFGRSTMLPAAAYTDPAVLAWERRHIFASSWLPAGRVDDVLPRGTAVRAVVAGDVGVLVVRAADGLRAFANTCRHRGHELLAEGESTSRRVVVCPYHAWTYATDGSLVAAPAMDASAGFDPGEHGLVPVPVADWHGWLLVDATATAPPLATWLGALDGRVAAYDPATLRVGARQSYVVEANWKLLVENYHECYHCPLIHPELCEVTPPDSGDNFDEPGMWVGGAMELRPGAVTMSFDGTSRAVAIPGVDAGRVLYVGLFPNLLLSLHPDYVMTHRLTPLEPARTAVDCTWLFRPEAVERPDFDPSYAVDFWHRTNEQDWGACASVQRGVASPHFRPGPLAPNEDAVHQWVRLVGELYTGRPVADLAERIT